MHEVRFLLFLTLAAPGTAAATTAAAPFFLLAEPADGMAHRKTQHRQNDDISHGFSLYTNADAGIRVFAFPNRQINETHQRPNGHDGHGAKGRLPGH